MKGDHRPSPIIVRDFNPHAVRAALAREDAQGRCDRGGVQRLPNGNRQDLKVAVDVIQAGTVFREDVQSALPYIETVTQKEFGYDAVFIDEERILGLEVRSLFRILSWCQSAHSYGDSVEMTCFLFRRRAKTLKLLLLMFTSSGDSAGCERSRCLWVKRGFGVFSCRIHLTPVK